MSGCGSRVAAVGNVFGSVEAACVACCRSCAMGSFIVAFRASIFVPFACLAYLLLVTLLLPSCDESPSSSAAAAADRCLCSSPLQKLELGLDASSKTDDFTASRMDSGSGRSGKGDDASVRTALSPTCFLPTVTITERRLRRACLATTTPAADVREIIADGSMSCAGK